MELKELTTNQQSFATEHHNLVYTFLKKKKLHSDEYYDVIIFGYLRAVQKYLIRSNLRTRYSFSTIAWRAMECELSNHRIANSRLKRRGTTVSLDAMQYCTGSFKPDDFFPGSDSQLDQLDAKRLWLKVSTLLSEPQRKALRMSVDGYSLREIASAMQKPVLEIKALLTEAAETASGPCPA